MEPEKPVPLLMRNGTTLETTRIPLEGGKNVILNLVKPTLRTKPLTTHFDSRSQMGQFGWTTIGNVHIPYIFRTGFEITHLLPHTQTEEDTCVRLVALRIVNQKLFPCFFNIFRQELFDIIVIPSFKMTEYERKNYNDINCNHCESLYGLNPFQKEEQVLRLDDVKQIYEFLKFMMQRHGYRKNIMHPDFGYMRFSGTTNLVPYYKLDGTTFMPVYYFEGDERSLSRKLRVLPHLAESIVKILIKLQNVLIEPSPIKFISFEEIQKYFEVNMRFKECWLQGHPDMFLNLGKTQEYSILRVVNCDGLSSNEVRYYNWLLQNNMQMHNIPENYSTPHASISNREENRESRKRKRSDGEAAYRKIVAFA